jgi:hypothetical protein
MGRRRRDFDEFEDETRGFEPLTSAVQIRIQQFTSVH